MCVICICKDRKLTDDEIGKCWETNSDGAGIANFVGRHVSVKKGIMTLSALKEAYAKLDSLPHVVHFRKVSVGGVSPQLTHPFSIDVVPTDLVVSPPLEYISSGVIFHNGTISGLGTAGVSDTSVLAFVMARLSAFSDAEWLLAHASGKFVVMKDNTITRFGDFTEDSGVFFSNEIWKQRAWYGGTNLFTGWRGNNYLTRADVDVDVITDKWLKGNVPTKHSIAKYKESVSCEPKYDGCDTDGVYSDVDYYIKGESLLQTMRDTDYAIYKPEVYTSYSDIVAPLRMARAPQFIIDFFLDNIDSYTSESKETAIKEFITTFSGASVEEIDVFVSDFFNAQENDVSFNTREYLKQTLDPWIFEEGVIFYKDILLEALKKTLKGEVE